MFLKTAKIIFGWEQGKGLNRLKKSVITAQSIKDGLSDTEVYPIYRDSKNNIWVGTAKGLNIYRNGKFEPVNFVQSGKTYSEVSIWKNNGNVNSVAV